MAECYCINCDKYMNHHGVGRHRSMHKDKREKLEMRFSNGKVYFWDFEKYYDGKEFKWSKEDKKRFEQLQEIEKHE